MKHKPENKFDYIFTFVLFLLYPIEHNTPLAKNTVKFLVFPNEL